MATPTKREYPRLPNIKDQDVKESLRLLWNKVHDHTDTIASQAATIAQHVQTITSQSSLITTLQKKLTQLAPAKSTDQANNVGGGSGGTSGGSTGTPGGNPPDTPPSDIPNQSGAIAQAKADLIAGGIDISGPCGAWQIVNTTAFRLGGNYGLLSKDSGNNCNGMATDIIAVKPSNGAPQMPLFDALIDGGGANGPNWSSAGQADTSRWVAPSTPPV